MDKFQDAEANREFEEGYEDGDDLEILERPLAIDPDEFGLDENEKIQFYKSFNEVKP